MRPERPLEPAGTATPTAGAPVMSARRPGAREGAIGGILGGIAMGMLAMIAATVYGQNAMAQPGFAAGPVVVGMLIHLVVSAVYGAIYGAFAGARWTGGALVGWGIVWGLVLWAVTKMVILPIADPLMSRSVQPFLFAIEHVLYGAVLGWYLAARNRTGASPSR